jgi:hypothetical protein
MLVTAGLIALLIATLAVTYPEEFPQLISDPKQLFEAMSLEARRRWMIAKLGSQLWVERKRMAFSLWQMRDIIKQEQQKQQNKHDR